VIVKRKRAKPDFAVEIRSIREALRLTQQEFAARLGGSHSAVQKWERGDFAPHPRTMDLIRTFGRRGRSQLPPEQTDELHLALDIILEHAPQTLIDAIRERLIESAGKYGYHRS
jgi:transcriptional regulator with XRE-family HTH domain